MTAVSARTGDLAALLQPLNDPELSPERRTAIGHILLTQVTDLAAATGQSISQSEAVAREWHRIRPQDIETLLCLMEQAEKRNAFSTALTYLEKAERIDAVHSEVRAARLRLLAAGQ